MEVALFQLGLATWRTCSPVPGMVGENTVTSQTRVGKEGAALWQPSRLSQQVELGEKSRAQTTWPAKAALLAPPQMGAKNEGEVKKHPAQSDQVMKSPKSVVKKTPVAVSKMALKTTASPIAKPIKAISKKVITGKDKDKGKSSADRKGLVPGQEEQSKAIIAAQVLGSLMGSTSPKSGAGSTKELQKRAPLSPTSACSGDMCKVLGLALTPSVHVDRDNEQVSCTTDTDSAHGNEHSPRSGDLELPCNDCHRKFRRRSNLAKHVRTVHQAEREYRCSQCPASFTQPNSLKKHQSCVHQKLRRHICEECGGSFGQSGDLNVHVKTVHNSERAFPCGQCDMRFKMRQHLDKHVRMKHEKVRPFACPCCGRRFSEKTDAKRHVLHVHSAIADVVARVDTLLQPSTLSS